MQLDRLVWGFEDVDKFFVSMRVRRRQMNKRIFWHRWYVQVIMATLMLAIELSPLGHMDWAESIALYISVLCFDC